MEGRNRSGSRGGGGRFGSRGGNRSGGRGGGGRFGGGHGGFNRSHGGCRSGGGFSDRPREMHKATCSKCGNDCEVPFKPTPGKPVYCKECYMKNK